MGKFDKYLLSQLMVLFGFFSLILVMVYWVNRAVLLFDRLIGDGQSAGVFLEFTALTLPNVIRLVLPLSAFAAAVYATNRLSSESELVVVQATGFSSFRLARGVLAFGLIVALLISVLSHFLVPLAGRQLAQRQAEIAENVSARFLTEGRFLHPAKGITFYIRDISPKGELRDIFLSDVRKEGQRTTYSAKRALLVRSESGPKLVMFDGMAQTLRRDGMRLAITRFQDFSYDIGALINMPAHQNRGLAELSTTELLHPTPALLRETGASRGMFMAKAQERFSQPLFAVMAALLGFSALLVGGFSRFGFWRQILFAVVVLIVIKSMDNAIMGAIRNMAYLWPLAYVPPLSGLAVAGFLLYASEHPMLFRKPPATPQNPSQGPSLPQTGGW